MSNEEKRCGKCGKVKPLSLFYLQSLAAGGRKHQSRCKECSKISGQEYQRRRKANQTFAQKVDKEEDLLSTYSKADVRINGKLVMKNGKVLNLKWWKNKLKEKGRVREEGQFIV